MIPSVFDEHLVRIVAGDDDPRDEQPGNRCFEGVGIVIRYSCFRIYRHSGFAQEVETRRKTGHDVDAIRLQTTFTLTGAKHNVAGFDRLDATIPFHGYLAFLYAVGKIGQHPRLDLLVESTTEM